MAKTSPFRILRSTSSGEVLLSRAKLCISFLCHLRGLMFTASIPRDAGLLFVTPRESKVNSTIHMFFMRYSIAVIWMDKHGRVVDKQLAKPWRPAYTPKLPAQFYIEAHPDLLNRVQVGDQLTFDETATL